MWKLSLAHWPEYLCEAGLVALFVLADCLITIAVKYPGSAVQSWFPDPLGQRLVIGLGLGTATLLLIKYGRPRPADSRACGPYMTNDRRVKAIADRRGGRVIRANARRQITD